MKHGTFHLPWAASGSLILFSLISSGCSTTPKQEAWSISNADQAIIRDAKSWPVLSTNQYARVIDAKLDEAVLLLKDTPCIQLSSSQARILAPLLQTPDNLSLQPCLFRAVSYSIPPLLTVVRFDSDGARIMVRQYTYNGEMFWPYWHENHNAIVAYLPKAPQQVYPEAFLGGDGIGSGEKWIDTR